MKIFKYHKTKYIFNKKYSTNIPLRFYESTKERTEILQNHTNDKKLYIYKESRFGWRNNILIIIDNNRKLYAMEHPKIKHLLENEKIRKLSIGKRYGIVCLCYSGKVFSIEYDKNEQKFYTNKIFIKERVVDVKYRKDIYVLTDQNRLKIYKCSKGILSHQRTLENVKKISVMNSNVPDWMIGILRTDNILVLKGEKWFLQYLDMFKINDVQDFKFGPYYVLYRKNDKYYTIGYNTFLSTRKDYGSGNEVITYYNGESRIITNRKDLVSSIKDVTKILNIDAKRVVKYTCTNSNIVFITNKNKAYVYISDSSLGTIVRHVYTNIKDFHKESFSDRAFPIDFNNNCIQGNGKILRGVKIYTQSFSLFNLCIQYIRQYRKRFGKRINILPKDIRKCL